MATRTKKTTVKALHTPGYKAANGHQRDVAAIETKAEGRIVTANKRLRLIAQQRDIMRNTMFAPATAEQVQNNVVGTDGGKLTVTTGNRSFDQKASETFRTWARHAGFTDGMHLNEMLALMVTQLTHTGGDFIAMFDDGALTTAPGSGRLMIFEADQIKPVTEAEFLRLYPRQKNGKPAFFQDNGLIRDKFNRIVGAFVGSRRDDEEGRGLTEYKRGEYLHLRLNTPADFVNSPWTLVAKTWRPNQGRGIATATYVSNAVQDMADIVASEIIAAKLNSSVALVERNTDGVTENDGRGAAITAAEGAEAGMTDEEIAAYNAALTAGVNALRSGGSAVFKDAAGRKLESFDAKRPASNMLDFLGKIEGMATTPFGFGKLFATLDPQSSYIASRGAMVLARKAFEKLQKKMEREVLDWLAPKVLKWYGLKAPADIENKLCWSWPDMVEIDEGAFQTALEKRFSNFEATLKERHGANWREFVDAIAEEASYCADKGILHPALRTVSGGQIETPEATETEDPKEVTE